MTSVSQAGLKKNAGITEHAPRLSPSRDSQVVELEIVEIII